MKQVGPGRYEIWGQDLIAEIIHPGQYYIRFPGEHTRYSVDQLPGNWEWYIAQAHDTFLTRLWAFLLERWLFIRALPLQYDVKQIIFHLLEGLNFEYDV